MSLASWTTKRRKTLLDGFYPLGRDLSDAWILAGFESCGPSSPPHLFRWLNNKGLLGSVERMVHRVEIVGQDAGWTCGFVENENVREGFFLSVKFAAFPWDRL